MRFYIDGELSSYSLAKNHAAADARSCGMDPAEFEAIWDRACRSDEDGEYARDDLSNFCSVVEISAVEG